MRPGRIGRGAFVLSGNPFVKAGPSALLGLKSAPIRKRGKNPRNPDIKDDLIRK